jgi:hypothetical protein
MDGTKPIGTSVGKRLLWYIRPRNRGLKLKLKAVVMTNQILVQASVLGIFLGMALAAGAETTLLDTGYGQMYNLQFDQAHRTFSEYQQLHPEDPMAAVSDAAAYLFTEFDRLHILQSEFFVHDDHFYTDSKLAPDPLLKQKFEAALKHAANWQARHPRILMLFSPLYCVTDCSPITSPSSRSTMRSHLRR